MLKTHNRSYKYKSNDAMASRMLTHSWLKFTDSYYDSVFNYRNTNIYCTVTVFNSEESSPCAAYFPTRDTRHSDLISKLSPGMAIGSLLLYLYLLLCVFSILHIRLMY